MAKQSPCACETPGPWNCGIKGILANSERCDTCETYPDDKTAKTVLALVRAANTVLHNWERGNLAAAVRHLDEVVTRVKEGR